MSAKMVAVLRCDHEDCDECFVWNDATVSWRPPRLMDARAAAHRDGWRHGVRLRPDAGPAPSFDFCPARAGDVIRFHEVTP